jgi:WD40 repeat protein
VLAVVLATCGGQTQAQDRPEIEVVPRVPHVSAVSSVAFSPDGISVLSGSYDNTIRLWDAATGTLLRTFEVRSPVTQLLFRPTALACCPVASTTRLGCGTPQRVRSCAPSRGIPSLSPRLLFRRTATAGCRWQ